MPSSFGNGLTNFLNPWGGRTSLSYVPQAAGLAGQLVGQPGQFAGVLGGMYDSYQKGYGTYNQGLASLGDSYAKNYGAMAGGVGQIATALGNTWNNAQAQNPYASSAEAARQMTIGNLGTAAMTGYGQASNAAMQAWSANQSGYQKALADMQTSNQNAVSQLGQSRNNALAGLGKSAATYGLGNSIAGALPGLMGSINGNPAQPGQLDTQGWGALDALRGDLNSQSDANRLSDGYRSALEALNRDQDKARDVPTRQIDTAYQHLTGLNRMNLDASSRGMDQFYENYGPYQPNTGREGQRIPTGSLLDALAAGYTDSANRISGAQSDMRSGWADASKQYTASRDNVNDLFNRTIGKLDIWQTAEEAQQQQWRLEDAAEARRQMLAERARLRNQGTGYDASTWTPAQLANFTRTGVLG